MCVAFSSSDSWQWVPHSDICRWIGRNARCPLLLLCCHSRDVLVLVWLPTEPSRYYKTILTSFLSNTSVCSGIYYVYFPSSIVCKMISVSHWLQMDTVLLYYMFFFFFPSLFFSHSPCSSQELIGQRASRDHKKNALPPPPMQHPRGACPRFYRAQGSFSILIRGRSS